MPRAAGGRRVTAARPHSGPDLLPGQREGAAPGRGGAGAEPPPGRTEPTFACRAEGRNPPSPLPPPPRRPLAAAPADSRLCRLNRNLLRRPPPGPGAEREARGGGLRGARHGRGGVRPARRLQSRSRVLLGRGRARAARRPREPPAAAGRHRRPTRRPWRGPAAAADRASVRPWWRAGLRSASGLGSPASAAGSGPPTMGNTTSCCVSSSPKLRRNAHSRLESYRPDADLSREDTGCNLQHISDRENIDGERGPAGTCTLPQPGCLALSGCGPGSGAAGGGGLVWATTKLFTF